MEDAKKQPYIVGADDLADWHLTIRAGVLPRFPFPVVSCTDLPGFRPTQNRYLVDPSGRGAEGKPALTIGALLKRLREGHAYAIVEATQSHWSVQEYEPLDGHRQPPAERSRDTEWSDSAEMAVLMELAFKDAVTGLYNRPFFSIMVATILLRQTRGINVVSRYDGGLFAILMVETSEAGARLYVDRVRHFLSSSALSEPYPVTTRFGIAGLREDSAETAETILQRADEALRAGRCSVR